jgi:predicted MFS family arabinose efflux permease
MRSWQLPLLCAVATTSVLAMSVMNPLQEAIRVALGLSDNQLAILQGPAMAMPLTIGSIPCGLLIDRRSRVRLIFIFAALTLIGTLLTALASSFAVLLAARCLVGFVFPAISMASLSMIADLYTPDRRGRAYMFLSFGSVLGTSAAFALGGMLLGIYGSEANGWRWTMVCLTAPLLPVLFLSMAMREPARTGVVVINPSVRASLVELWRYRAVVIPLQISLIMVGIVDVAAAVWAMPALSRHLASPPQRIGPIIAMASLVSAVAGPATGGLLADACQRAGGPRRSISVLGGLVFLSAPAGLFSIMPGMTSAGVLLAVFMTLGNAISLMGTSIGTIVIPNELRGLYIAVVATVSALFCGGLAPLVVSMQATAMGGPMMIGSALALTCVTISLLGAVVLVFARRYFANACQCAPGSACVEI